MVYRSGQPGVGLGSIATISYGENDPREETLLVSLHAWLECESDVLMDGARTIACVSGAETKC